MQAIEDGRLDLGEGMTLKFGERDANKNVPSSFAGVARQTTSLRFYASLEIMQH